MVIIYLILVSVDILLVVISRDAIKTSGDGVCMCESSSQAAQRKETWNWSSCSLSVKLKDIFFFLTVIPVQLELPQFKHFWENIKLMGDAIREHSAEFSKHKNSLSR